MRACQPHQVRLLHRDRFVDVDRTAELEDRAALASSTAESRLSADTIA
jgi:hypothetical protein